MANLYSGSALSGGSMAVIKNDGPDDDARQASALVGEHYTAREGGGRARRSQQRP